MASAPGPAPGAALMRIVWTSHSAEIGGAQFALVEAVTALSQRGHEVHVVLPAEGPLRARLTSAAAVYVVPSNHWRRGPSPAISCRWMAYDLARAVPAMARVLRTVRAEVAVTNTLVEPSTALAAASVRIPHVWFAHEYPRADLALLFGRAMTLRIVGWLSNAVLANSEALRAELTLVIPAQKVRVARYAINVARSEPTEQPPNEPFRMALAGFMTANKGQRDAVEATAILRSRGLSVELWLIGLGEPAYEEELRILVKELGLAEAVRFIGFVEAPEAYVGRCHVALMCSRSEALGRVTVEAMKLAKPVVGASAGGTVELVRPGWNGLLYRAGNARDLADQVEVLYRDRAAARRMGENGRQWAWETFNPEAYGRQLEAALRASTARGAGAEPPR